MKEFLIWLSGILIIVLIGTLFPTLFLKLLWSIIVGGWWGYIWEHKYVVKDW